MRRLVPVLLAALVTLVVLLPATAAVAAGPDAADMILAVEQGPVTGPEPDLHGPNAPAEYEPPFLINAAYGLAAAMVGLVALLGGLYWLLVKRPEQARAQH